MNQQPVVFEVFVYWSDPWWMVSIPEIDGLTQTKDVFTAHEEAADFIAVDQNLQPGTFRIKLENESLWAVREHGGRGIKADAISERSSGEE